MKIFRIYLPILSAIAVSSSLVLGSSAQATPSQAYEDTEGDDAAFFFETTCDRNTAASPSLLERAEPSSSAQPPWFRPSCMLMGDQDGARYLCKCEDNNAAAVGQLEREEIFPEGSLPAEVNSEEHARLVSQLSKKVCKELFDTQCGPFPDDLDERCESPHGECNVTGRGFEQAGEYIRISAECSCENGDTWSSGDRALQSRSFTSEDAQNLCEAELRACEPSSTPGPSELRLFPDEQLEVRDAFCLAQDEDKGLQFCELRSTGKNVMYHCFCEDSGIEVTRFVAADGWKPRQGLYQQCTELVAKLCSNASDGSAEPEVPEDPGHSDDGGIGDILDKLGCNLAPTGPAKPWMLPGFALCLIGLRRRR